MPSLKLIKNTVSIPRGVLRGFQVEAERVSILSSRIRFNTPRGVEGISSRARGEYVVAGVFEFQYPEGC